MRNALCSALAAFLVILPLAAGAGEPPFIKSADQTLPAPPADKAQIVFLDPANNFNGGWPVGLYEIEGEQRTLLAITGAHSKVVLNFSPGHHRLMSDIPIVFAHFMDMDVEAGKTYYVLMRFVYGRGFQLRPLRSSGSSEYSINNPQFNDWVSSTHFVEMTPTGINWFEKSAKHVDKSQAKGLLEWNAKSPEERAELTLTPQDAVAQTPQPAPAPAASP